MTKIVDGLLYTKDDEWVKVEGEMAIIGVTDYAQDALSDIVFVELPRIGKIFGQGDKFGIVESVKAAADLYMPVGGTVAAVNKALPDAPELVNSDPYNKAWMIKIEITDTAQLTSLMDAEAYRVYRAES